MNTSSTTRAKRTTPLRRVPKDQPVYAVARSAAGYRWAVWHSPNDAGYVAAVRTAVPPEDQWLARRAPLNFGIEETEVAADLAAQAVSPLALRVASEYIASVARTRDYQTALLDKSREIAKRIEASSHLTRWLLGASGAIGASGAMPDIRALARALRGAYDLWLGTMHGESDDPFFRLAIRRLRGEPLDEGRDGS